MERAPSKLPSTSSRLIATAISLVGSADELRAYMRSTEEDFRDYRTGVKEMSWPELDRLIALIIREQRKVVTANRELLRKIRAKERPPKS